MQGPPRPEMEPPQRCAGPSPSLSASSTAFVISSTNSGMPSVRSTISAITSEGSSLLPTKARDDGGCFTPPEPVERHACHV